MRIMDFLLAILDIAIAVFSALLFITAALNLSGFLLQVKSGEEDLKVKFPTFLNLVGTTFLGLSGSIGLIAPDLGVLQKATLATSLALLIAGTYLGLQKHAVRYLGEKGEPMKVSFAGTHKMRHSLRKKGIHMR
jgi:hypothetical protein